MYHKYGFEILCVSACLLYLLVSYLGRRQNVRFAAKIARAYVSGGVIGRQFHKCTPDEGASGGGRVVHMQESASWYRMFCTGRQRCSYMHLRMLLKRRHDLVGMLYSLVQPDNDEVIFEVYFDERDMQDMVLTVARSPAVMKQLVDKEFKEIATYGTVTGGMSSANLAAGMEARMEHRELIEGIVLADPTLRRLLTTEGDAHPSTLALRKMFRYLHISSEVHYEFPYDKNKSAGDQTVSTRMRVATLAMRLPRGEDSVQEGLPLVEAVCNLIDLISGFKYSAKAKEKIVRSREEGKKALERAERRKMEEKARERKLAKEEGLNDKEKEAAYRKEQERKFKKRAKSMVVTK